MKTLLVFMLVLLTACTQIPPLTPNVSPVPETSSVLLFRAKYDLTIDDGFPRYQLACGGVAINNNIIMTASHCVGEVGSVLYYKDRDIWFTTTDYQEAAYVVLVNADTDVAYLRTTKPLKQYAILRKPVTGEFKLVVRQFNVTHDYASQVGHVGIQLHQSDSGSGVFAEDGALLGVITHCNPPPNLEYTINDTGPCAPGGIYNQ